MTATSDDVAPSEHRVAIVTGAARGIGAATALNFANLGWTVAAIDRCDEDTSMGYPLASRADLDAVVAAGHGRITGHVVDVTDYAALASVVAQIEADHDGLDVAVASAGVIGGGVPHWESDAAMARAVIEVDLVGVMSLARMTVPAMLRRESPRSGRFVAVASAAATRGLPMLAAYCAAKAGVTGFVRALAVELRGSGITANAVSPGSTRTDILTASAELYGLVDRELFSAQQPIERLIEPHEIAATIAHLAAVGSGAITGASVAVDGGLSL